MNEKLNNKTSDFISDEEMLVEEYITLLKTFLDLEEKAEKIFNLDVAEKYIYKKYKNFSKDEKNKFSAIFEKRLKRGISSSVFRKISNVIFIADNPCKKGCDGCLIRKICNLPQKEK